MTITVNGQPYDAPADLRVSLLDLLRETLGQTGSKKGCNQGACGACTILVDGERVLACLALAVQYEGRSIITIEGLADGESLHPLQALFIAHDGFQCGYCTPGQVMSALALRDEFARGAPSNLSPDLEAPPARSRLEIQERMSGNLCRCGAHRGIIDAIATYISEDRE
ncbi:MAG: 2Fe-2S iron-sulfur cluster-binding protein [Pseudomonadota bacterium]